MSNKVNLTELFKDEESNIAVIDINGVNVEVKRVIGLQDVFEFVSLASGMCFGDDGEYSPWAKDFAIKKYILEKYTNIEVPNDVSECYSSIYTTGVVNEVLKVIDREQIGEIVNSVDEAVSYTAKANIEAINVQLNNINNEFGVLMSKIEKLFDGANPDEVGKMLDMIMTFGNMDKEMGTTKSGDK